MTGEPPPPPLPRLARSAQRRCWPEELSPVFTRMVTAQFTSLTRGGAPIMVPDVSLSGNRLTAALRFLGKGPRLVPRLQPEAARRGQPVPEVRLPRRS